MYNGQTRGPEPYPPPSPSPRRELQHDLTKRIKRSFGFSFGWNKSVGDLWYDIKWYWQSQELQISFCVSVDFFCFFFPLDVRWKYSEQAFNQRNKHTHTHTRVLILFYKGILSNFNRDLFRPPILLHVLYFRYFPCFSSLESLANDRYNMMAGVPFCGTEAGACWRKLEKSGTPR